MRRWELNWRSSFERARSLLGWAVNRVRRISPEALKYRVLLILLLILGFGLRIYVAEYPGYQADMRQWIEWSDRGASGPLGRIYTNSNTNYPPGFAYVFWTMGKFRQWVPQLTMPGVRYRFMKLPGMLGDILVSCLLLAIVARERGRWMGLWIFAAYLFNPAPISDSSHWGQFDGLTALWPLAGVVLLQRGKWWGVGIVSALALSTKFQTSVFIPVLFLFILVDHGLWKTLGSLLIFVLTFGLICAPYLAEGQLSHMVERAYLVNLGLHRALTVNALNFWKFAGAYVPDDEASLLHLGWGLHLRPVYLGLFMLLVAWIPAAFIGASCRDWLGRCYALGFVGVAFFMLPTQIHERYLLPAVSFLAPACPLGVVSTLSYAGASHVHLLSCYARPEGKLVAMMGNILVPCFLVMFYRLQQDAAPRSPTDYLSRTRNRLGKMAAAIGYRLAKRMWITAGVLTLCIAGVFLGVRGWVHRQFEEVSLVRLGVSRSENFAYNQGLDGTPLSVGGERIDRGIQAKMNSPVRFIIPPGFSALRFAAGIDDISAASAAGNAGLTFIVRLQNTEIYRSNAISLGDPIEQIEIPLKRPHGELVLVSNPSGFYADLRGDWIDPRLVRASASATDQDVLYVSDVMRSPSLLTPLRQAGIYHLDRSYETYTLRIKGRTYPKGIGTHADSRLEIRIPPGYSRFVTDIGYDDAISSRRVKGNIRMQFSVIVDGEERYRSPEIQPGNRIENIEIPVAGAKVLVLLVDSLGDTTCDHADWGGARFER
jgi:Gpi18-like mannosyltransferase